MPSLLGNTLAFPSVLCALGTVKNTIFCAYIVHKIDLRGFKKSKKAQRIPEIPYTAATH